MNLVLKLVPILFEDDRLLAVVKPAGVDVGAKPGHSTPGLVELLAAVRGPGDRLEPINRLSRFESGVLLLGKEPEIVRTLRADLRAGRVRQEYYAVVLGKVRYDEWATERTGSTWSTWRMPPRPIYRRPTP